MRLLPALLVAWSPLPILTLANAPKVQFVDTVAEAVRSCVALATIGSYMPKSKLVTLIVQDALTLAVTAMSEADVAA